MNQGRISLKEMDLGEYVLLARPTTYISTDAVRRLEERARNGNVDFLGIIHGHVDDPDIIEYDKVMSLKDNPALSIIIRNVCAGIYKKDFMKKHKIALRTNKDTIFPDLDLLWLTFVFCDKALLENDLVCERVELDTVWINDKEAAFSVNRQYDYIKDVLMNDWQIWEKWKSYYTLQRYRCYFEMLHWMCEDVGWVFAERMAVDIHRSIDLDEIDEEIFCPEERTALAGFAMDAGFMKRFYLAKPILGKRIYDLAGDLDREKRECERILDAQRKENEARIAYIEQDFQRRIEAERAKYESSTTFRVGKLILFIPIKFSKLLKRIAGRS